MADNMSPAQRSFNMSRIKDRNTRPEMIVRSMVHHMGYRFRLHSKKLPGRPDLVFPIRRKIIFVHGCFFHMHTCHRGMDAPKTNAEFWLTKRLSNAERDRRNIAALENEGWQVLIIWECQTKDPQHLRVVIADFLRELT